MASTFIQPAISKRSCTALTYQLARLQTNSLLTGQQQAVCGDANSHGGQKRRCVGCGNDNAALAAQQHAEDATLQVCTGDLSG